MWSVYILQCGDGSFYTGITNDLERRFKDHSEGHGSRYTRSHMPVQLLDFVQVLDRTSALRLEARVKRHSKDQKLAVLREGAMATPKAIP